MRRPLALLRPEPGWSASAAAARVCGLKVVGHPLFEAEALTWKEPEGAFGALLVGSGAVFRHGGTQLGAFRDLPVHAVGEATAAAAREAGFAVSHVGEGGLQTILDSERNHSIRYLRLGGEERVKLRPNAGQTIVERAVYRMRALPFGDKLVSALDRDEPLVALHSAAAARHFSGEIDRLGIPRGRLFLLVLGPRIAKAAGLGWAALHVAERPSDAALLAKAAALCQ